MNENLLNQIVAVLLRDGSVPMTAEELAGYVSPAVAGLVKDYIFKGVVNPKNSPGFITSPTAVVACTGGTYRGYSNIVLDQFTIALFVSDDGAVWEKVEIFNAVKAEIAKAGIAKTAESMPEDGILPNVLYNLGELTDDTEFRLAPGAEGEVNHYYWTFDTPAEDLPTIFWPEDILVWNGGEAPEIAAEKHYEISVLDGVAAFMETDIPVLNDNR